ncbi:hypothetical protein KC351_g11036 [Hortaea werneckii]|nr:hypothetical protein KC351_g11036 [Hortaea werneckii]
MSSNEVTMPQDLQGERGLQDSFAIPMYHTIYSVILKSTGNDFGRESEVVVDLDIGVLGGKNITKDLTFTVPDSQSNLNKTLIRSASLKTFFLPPTSITLKVFEHDNRNELVILHEVLNLSNVDKWLKKGRVMFTGHKDGYEAHFFVEVFKKGHIPGADFQIGSL